MKNFGKIDFIDKSSDSSLRTKFDFRLLFLIGLTRPGALYNLLKLVDVFEKFEFKFLPISTSQRLA